ncbi:MAG: hypothetical protein JWR56_1689 [Massilia sp.]|nr:hypothetical protein [Massilia sp.]
MQTQPLPIQVSSASSAPTRATGAANTDSAQFSQALSREMEQRQHSPAPAAASQPAPARPQAGPAPQASAPAKPTAPAQGKPADEKAAGAVASDAGDDAQDDAADAAAVSPVTDMLALVASFNQPVADPAVAAAVQATGLPAATARRGKDDNGVAAMPTLAVDDKGLPIKDVAPAIVGAGFAMKTLPGAAEPKPAPLETGAVARFARGADHALAGAVARKPDADSAPADTFKPAADKAALQGAPVQPDQLRTREAGAELAALKDLPAAAPLVAPAQQAAAAISQAVGAAPAERIAARVGTPAWDNQVGQKIVWMVAGKEQSASLTLNPPDMGPMQVVLSVTNDQATVTFSAAQPEVRQALENAMPKLREMMSESGIALGNATVNAGSPDQRQAQQGEQSRGGGSGGRFGGGGAEMAIPAAAARPVRQSGGEGLVDTFA